MLKKYCDKSLLLPDQFCFRLAMWVRVHAKEDTLLCLHAESQRANTLRKLEACPLGPIHLRLSAHAMFCESELFSNGFAIEVPLIFALRFLTGGPLGKER